jgi:hypothetical protein
MSILLTLEENVRRVILMVFVQEEPLILPTPACSRPLSCPPTSVVRTLSPPPLSSLQVGILVELVPLLSQQIRMLTLIRTMVLPLPRIARDWTRMIRSSPPTPTLRPQEGSPPNAFNPLKRFKQTLALVPTAIAR